MVQILDRPTFGGQLGSALGGALGQGISALAEQKLRQMQFEKAGLPSFLAHYPPELLKQVNLAEAMRRGQGQQGTPQPESSFSDFLSAIESAQVPTQARDELRRGLDVLTSPQSLQGIQEQAFLDQYRQPVTEQPKSTMDFLNLINQANLARLPGQQQADIQAQQTQEGLQRLPEARQQAQEEQELQKFIDDLKKQSQEIRQQMAQQQPMVQQEPAQQASLFGKPLTEAQRLELEYKKASLADREQTHIDASNKPFMDAFRTQADNADRIYDTASELLELLKSGEVASDWLGGYVSGKTRLQNEATQRAEKLMEELASFKASELRGPVTGIKIQVGRATKPNLYQTPKTQKYLTQRIMEQIMPIRIKRQIRDSLIAKNGGKQPRSIETKINQEYEKYKKLPLPMSEGLKDGDDAIDDKTGQTIAIVQNGEWIPV